MSVAALFDIHSNLPALEAVLEEVLAARVDLVVVGGDVVPGPMPRETLARLLALDLPVRFLRGNGDRVAIHARAGGDIPEVPPSYREVVRWTGEQLDSEQAELVSAWPMTVRLEIDGLGTVLFCHATPRSDREIVIESTSEDRLARFFGDADAPLVVCGHTHMAFDRTAGGIRIVNAGSVGMPFGEPGADWLLLGPDVQPRHTSYDLETAAARIRATSYPQADDFAANSVLRPPSRAAMLEIFARAETESV